ncbi:MAG TPA: hypothetical protein VG755_08615 [Nannocystaceae bacterium]|nr:hypothetical protein [Nannocystaceae bacterium]
MNRTKLLRTGASLLLSSPLFAGCIFTMADDSAGDGSDSAVSDTDFDDDTGVSSNATTPSDDSSSDDSSNVDESGGETTDGPVGECSETLIVDGGFEAGTPSTAWTEASDAFGTPICDVDCTTDEGAGPYAGDWYAWFGGVEEAEHASVTQHVSLDGTSAYLSFRFEINASAGTGDDVFTVTIDDETVFMATDLEIEDYASYTPISIDVSDFGAGDHVVELRAELAGTGLSSFFVDEVAMVTCDDGSDSSGSDDASSDTTAADSGSSDDGATDSGSSDDGSSSDDGGSSGSESGSTGM